jgi:invasion protein IalB
MRKIFCIILYFLFSANLFAAELIDNISKEEKKFGDWTVTCDEDEMMEKIDCKIFSTFVTEGSSIYIQPNNKVANQVVIIVPLAKEGTNLKFKVDKNDLISSDNIVKNDEYGIIPFSPSKQRTMLSQIKNGQILYIRFTVNDPQAVNGEKEITAKISLAEFPKLLIYYDMKTGNDKK